jgi:hypothetical protein
MDRPGTCIILDKKYNIANSSCHFGSYGSIWTGPSPKIYYVDFRSFGPYMFLVTDRSIYCHMTLSAMNYLLYRCPWSFASRSIIHQHLRENKHKIRYIKMQHLETVETTSVRSNRLLFFKSHKEYELS